MIVSEFIEWLKTQDQGATVEVLKREYGKAWNGDSIYIVEFNPEEYSHYSDLRGNPFAVGNLYENSRTLLLGED